MSHAKKTLVMFLLSALLGGGAWYLNTTGVLGGLSSSAFGSTFVCSPENLKTQAKEYRQKLILQRKATVHRDTLEATIVSLRDAGNIAEMQEQQKNLRVLIRGMGSYNRFIKAYVACQKKLQDIPVVTMPPETTIILDSAPILDTPEISPTRDTTAVTTQRVSQPSTGTTSSIIPTTTDIPATLPPAGDIPSTTEAPVTTIPDTTVDIPSTTQPAETTEAAPDTTQESSVTSAPDVTTESIPEDTPSDTTAPSAEV